ncbi:MAG TPA: XRE family transcriptional regulator [Vicinamibacterales bacterium]|nr:XRE family transcriptional regulator [Vicinamibacterales bacterium]
MNRVDVPPKLLTWARERAGLTLQDLAGRFPKVDAWEQGQQQPTLRQLEEFARAVHVPIGFLFLPGPPAEPLPVPDLRTVSDRPVARPSPDLLDTLYLCQQRQDWFREYARIHGLERVPFIGTASVDDDPARVAERMRQTLGLSVDERQRLPTWTDALRQLAAKADDAGVLVMASSIVGSNVHRKLRVEEFRGFALVDDLAPLVFVNAADSKSAQMFTLAHELAHVWLGESGVSDAEVGRIPTDKIERWCNTAAAELLAPLSAFKAEYRPDAELAEEVQRLARHFKVSTLVALRRVFDAGFIDEATLWQAYRGELERIRTLDAGGSGGGDFYRTLGVRTGKRFARAVLSSALEGQTLFQDAFRMLGVRKTATFYKAARKLGVLP